MTSVAGRGPWPFVAGASVQGRDHLARGVENQDAFHAAVSEDGAAIVIAVSDGAGSRKRSSLGSHVAVDAACRVLAAGTPARGCGAAEWQSWLSAAGRTVIQEYLRVAGETAEAAAPDDDRTAAVQAMAATLAAAVICPPWACFLSLGDCFGAVLTTGPPERCHLVLPPDSYSEFTVFLSSLAAQARMRSFVVWEPELSGVMLATDGCASLALDHPDRHGLVPAAGPQPAPGFFLGLAASVRAADGDGEPLRDLLAGEQAERCTDDLTVVCALAGAG
jgi:Protein phosphatase 2C